MGSLSLWVQIPPSSRLFPSSSSSSSSSSFSSGVSATLARLDHHVGELFDARCAAHEVDDGEGLQVLGHAAGRGRGLRVQLVIQGQDLGGRGHHI